MGRCNEERFNVRVSVPPVLLPSPLPLCLCRCAVLPVWRVVGLSGRPLLLQLHSARRRGGRAGNEEETRTTLLPLTCEDPLCCRCSRPLRAACRRQRAELGAAVAERSSSLVSVYVPLMHADIIACSLLSARAGVIRHIPLRLPAGPPIGTRYGRGQRSTAVDANGRCSCCHARRCPCCHRTLGSSR
jgi:hypothetical protein